MKPNRLSLGTMPTSIRSFVESFHPFGSEPGRCLECSSAAAEHTLDSDQRSSIQQMKIVLVLSYPQLNQLSTYPRLDEVVGEFDHKPTSVQTDLLSFSTARVLL